MYLHNFGNSHLNKVKTNTMIHSFPIVVDGKVSKGCLKEATASANTCLKQLENCAVCTGNGCNTSGASNLMMSTIAMSSAIILLYIFN